MQLFKAATLPHLMYCRTVWHFCTASDSRKLERVQGRGLRAVYCNWNAMYSELLNSARLPTLLNRRLQDIVTIIYRIKKQLCPKYIYDLFVPNNSRYNLRVKEFIPRINTIPVTGNIHRGTLDLCYGPS